MAYLRPVFCLAFAFLLLSVQISAVSNEEEVESEFETEVEIELNQNHIPLHKVLTTVKDKATGYIACIVDGPARDMGQTPGVYGYNSETGRAYCAGLGYAFFALQDGGWLACSNTFGNYPSFPQVDDKECGDDRRGRGWRNAVYTAAFTPLHQRLSIKDKNTGYIGCVIDNEKRDMGASPGVYGHNWISGFDYCKKLAFSYFALQNGGWLTCSNTFGNTLKNLLVSDGECGGVNGGGGGWRNAVYSTSFEPLHTKLAIKNAATGYIGCIVDGPNRDMGDKPGQYGYTPTTGRAYCLAKGFAFFALQNGGWLTCSNTFGSAPAYKVVDDNECGVNRLGGGWRNAVHSTFVPLSSTMAVRNKTTGYIGCIIDDENRDMGAFPGEFGYTVDTGRAYCASRGFQFFALQSSGWLTCANSFGNSISRTYKQVNDSECGSDRTGGTFRNAVYSIPLYLRLAIKEYNTGFIACFADGPARDMGANPGQYGYTPTTGRAYCAKLGFAYFALQNGGWLTCANSFGNGPDYFQADDFECGNNRLGGGWRNAVYSTFLPLSTVLPVKDKATGYMACFQDDINRDGGVPVGKGYDAETGYTYCANLGFPFFALQDGVLTCANSFGNSPVYKQVSDTQCGSDKLAINSGGYLACLIDDGARDISTVVGNGNYNSQTGADYCGKRGFAYFALQHHGQLFCSNDFGNAPVYKQVDDSECGDDRLGRGWRNAIYYIPINKRPVSLLELKEKISLKALRNSIKKRSASE